eukprot:TRINITY_DN918_c0_g2_i1.p1 TRINITY_DN918_c0_g2~~TRINITY_DN918_c0_g2_i1.p1  ORF type:complete len:349 (-),score=88.25 TRINITY_DN918_c0_g2_i1:32-1036(-)
MEITFQKYPKIGLKGSPTDTQWHVMEKIHGSNFSFIINGDTYQCARRTGLLSTGERFYGWELIDDKYGHKMTQIFQQVAEAVEEDMDDVALVTVFGELFGGIYPHPDVPDLGYQFVQKGVYYTPGIEFAVFDIMVTGSDGTVLWMDWTTAMDILEANEMFYVKPLMTDVLSECRKFDIQINSTIPALLGLPPLDQNIIEGVVMKCVDRMKIIPSDRGIRRILKKKNKKFEEINPKPALTLYEMERDAKRNAESKFYEDIQRYVTENRLDNLISKIGPYDSSQYESVAQMLADDVWEDYRLDEPEQVEAIAHCLEKMETNVLNMCTALVQNKEFE